MKILLVERSAELDKKFSNKSELKIESENMGGGRVIGPLKILGLAPP